MKPVVLKLLEAKKLSDKGRFKDKADIIRILLREHPKQFEIDSKQTHTVGLTHKPSGFRIHATKNALPPEFLELQKAASLRAQLLDAFFKLTPSQ